MVRNLAKKASVYALGVVLNRGLSVLLLPLYTRHLKPADYGILSITSTTATVIGLAITLSLDNAVLLYYFQLEAPAYRRFLASVWLILTLAPLLVVLLLSLSGSALGALLFPTIPWSPYLTLALWIAYFSVAPAIALALFQAEQRSGAYVLFTLVTSALTSILVIYFVVFRGAGALGSLTGQLIAGMVLALAAHAIVLRFCKPWPWPGFDVAQCKAAVRLCLPFLPHAMFMWILNVSDRWILGRHVSMNDLGLYSIAYTIGMILYMLGWGMACGFQPIYFRGVQDPQFRAHLPRVISSYVLVPTCVALALCILAPEMLRVLARPAYYGAAFLVPWIAGAYWFFVAVYQVPMAVIQHHHRTEWTLWITGPAALLNITLNLLFVPRFGILAAAVSTLAAFALMGLIAQRLARRLDDFPFPTAATARMVCIALAAYWICTHWLSFPQVALAILAKLFVLAIAGCLMAQASGFGMASVRALLHSRVSEQGAG